METELRRDDEWGTYWAAKGPLALVAYGKTEEEAIERLEHMCLIWMEVAEPKITALQQAQDYCAECGEKIVRNGVVVHTSCMYGATQA